MKTLMQININVPDKLWDKLDDNKLESLIEQIEENLEIYLDNMLQPFGLEYDI